MGEHVLATEEYLATGSKTKAPDMGTDRKGCIVRVEWIAMIIRSVGPSKTAAFM